MSARIADKTAGAGCESTTIADGEGARAKVAERGILSGEARP